MGKTDKGQANESPPEGGQVSSETKANTTEQGRRMRVPDLKKLGKASCCSVCNKVLYVSTGILAIIIAIAVIIIAVLTSIATKIYDTDQSSRLVGMVVLAVTAAMTISIIIYASVAVFRKQTKPIHTASIVLFILALIQALVAGVSVKVTESDELNLGKSLAESFKLSREDNPRHVKLWTATQKDLTCCGVYSPEDYRVQNLPYYFTPNVPISCCPTYDPNRSELVQEREREVCKAKKSFYDVGCKQLVIGVFKETADMVLSVTIALIVLEILICFLGGCLCRNKKMHSSENESEE